MPALTRKLGLMEAVGVSLSMIGPTLGVAFNTSLVAGAAGPGMPLAFTLGTVVMALVGLSFVAFSRDLAHAGSAYAYVRQAFGRRWGFMAGWVMLLAYLAFTGATSALVGNFVDAAVRDMGLHLPRQGQFAGVITMLIAIYCVTHDMRLAARLMLLLEALSMLAITILSVVILTQVSRTTGLSAAPFRPAADFDGWSGIGYGIVFCVLSFAGFEGAATLGEEALEPRRNIPIAMIATVLLAGAFFVFASYAQVMGYGLGQMKALANADAPLNTLSIKFISTDFAVAVDLAAAVSAFSAALGALSASGRLLFALGREGLGERIGTVDPVTGTPKFAVQVAGGLTLVGLIVWAPFVGTADYYDYVGTIGTLGLILVYMGVTGAVLAVSLKSRQPLWITIGLAGTLVLIWPLWNSIYPVPAFPNNLWPYVVVAWIVLGMALLIGRPQLARAKVPEITRPLPNL